MRKRLAIFRFSLRALLGLVAMAALCCAAWAAFVQQNQSDWAREQQRMFDGGAVRWNERCYIPNLDIEQTATLPEWIIARLPLANRDIFYRVTTLDITAGPAHPEDFERCSEFSHVQRIRLGDFDDAQRLAAAFQQFPRLKTVELHAAETDCHGRSIADALAAELPGVEVKKIRR